MFRVGSPIAVLLKDTQLPSNDTTGETSPGAELAQVDRGSLAVKKKFLIKRSSNTTEDGY